MFVVRATRKLLDRVRQAVVTDPVGTTVLGDWCATALFWKPHVALFVNDSTLLPVLMPLAPAVTVVDRFPGILHDVLQAHEIPRRFVDAEIVEMTEHKVAKTSNRSVLGSMNEFSYMGREYRFDAPDDSLLALSLQLAEIPCGPLFKRHVTPADELRALVREHLA